MDLLTRMEELLLLSVWKLQDEAYGLAIRQHLSEMLDTDLSAGAVYAPIKRLGGTSRSRLRNYTSKLKPSKGKYLCFQ